ncbi:MAG TPA: tyrosine-type recombinase/integrase [Nitrosomonas sp.]|nr:tyrosine-type recombinase/integrase [Nitrosomonas sp.]
MKICPSNLTNKQLNKLSLKSLLLLALAIFCRVSELSSISREEIVFDSRGASFKLMRLRKNQRKGALVRISINRWETDSLLCPVHALERYLTISLELPILASSSLFVALNRPHKAVGPSTIARWLKEALSKAGVDVGKFSAHSTRGSATSNALKNGTPVDETLVAASWSNAKTFHRFYHCSTDHRDEQL